jgi:spore coat protein U-like protein
LSIKKQLGLKFKQGKFQMRKFAVIAAAAAAIVASSAAFGATKTDTFDVKIKITGTCASVVGGDVLFADAAEVLGTESKTATVSVKCSKNMPYSLSLDTAAAVMTGAVSAETIPYSTAWSATTGTGAGAATPVDHTLTVSLTTASQPAVDDYSQTRTVTLTY